jgi:hypothetical protein
LQEFDAGNYPEARAAFTHAHELYPNARTFRGLGFVAFELRNYIEAVTFLGEALRSEVKPLEDSQRRSTEELLARAQALVARVRLDVAPNTRSVIVDGVPAELSPGEDLLLEVGDHTLELRAAGYEPERRELSIAGGKSLKLSIRMRAVADSDRGQTASFSTEVNTDQRGQRRWYRSPWLWSAVAVVVAGAGVGIGFALTRRAGTHEAPPSTTGNTPPNGVIQTLRSW